MDDSPRCGAVDLRSYIVVTLAYWGFTVSDGALRMLVLLYFHELGYAPLEVASLFLSYEICGVLTNLLGGYVASRFGLKWTLFGGLTTQIFALVMLALLPATWPQWAAVIYVMASQSFSGIAKDLTKMSCKSAIKQVVPEHAEGVLFRWVALLTGSKNALKGIGFFVGGALLTWLGFSVTLWLMAASLALVLAGSVFSIRRAMGKSKSKVGFKQIFSKTPALNYLSAARFFLFGARDIWFVVGLPIFLYEKLGWTFTAVGAYFAFWVIGYGIIQAGAPKLFKRERVERPPHGGTSQLWIFVLTFVTAGIAYCIQTNVDPALTILIGLGLFGAVFAINSSIHSYLVLSYSSNENVAMDVGFYYMANAGGRLVGTILSGVLYQWFGLAACLWGAVICLVFSWLISFKLPKTFKVSTGMAEIKSI